MHNGSAWQIIMAPKTLSGTTTCEDFLDKDGEVQALVVGIHIHIVQNSAVIFALNQNIKQYIILQYK